MSQTQPEQVLVHAPYGRDATLICQVLGRAGIAADPCATVEGLCAALGQDTGAALISDESLTTVNVAALADVLSAQPIWSDLPLIITTSGGEATEASRRRLEILEPLGNVSLLERPLKSVTLVSSIQTALRARRRQYQLRETFVEREQLLLELRRSNEELAQFAHVVSHDLQAPIRMVKCFSELLALRYRGKLDTTGEEFIDTIQDGASSMEVLTRTLLNYATAGQAPITPAMVDLANVVDAVVTTLQPTIEELHADVSYSSLPTVSGDPVLLQQLIQNLASNALKYRDPAVTPRVRISARQAEHEWIISVEDNGQGVAPQHHESIFLPLTRLHGGDIFGTGMGLAVCRKILERHGGRIWIKSELGAGATFYFTLPILDVK
ncbi:MAG TPA: ATP-binding protein [Bryobacteraceae bacterium]|jgi:signal transduction histidine kinase